jgi:hypothetical protein
LVLNNVEKEGETRSIYYYYGQSDVPAYIPTCACSVVHALREKQNSPSAKCFPECKKSGPREATLPKSLPDSMALPRARCSRHRPNSSRHSLCREGTLGRALSAPLGRQRPLCREPRQMLSLHVCREGSIALGRRNFHKTKKGIPRQRAHRPAALAPPPPLTTPPEPPPPPPPPHATTTAAPHHHHCHHPPPQPARRPAVGARA